MHSLISFSSFDSFELYIIHPLSVFIFSVLVMAEGRVAFLGNTDEALKFFEQWASYSYIYFKTQKDLIHISSNIDHALQAIWHSWSDILSVSISK